MGRGAARHRVLLRRAGVPARFQGNGAVMALSRRQECAGGSTWPCRCGQAAATSAGRVGTGCQAASGNISDRRAQGCASETVGHAPDQARHLAEKSENRYMTYMLPRLRVCCPSGLECRTAAQAYWRTPRCRRTAPAAHHQPHHGTCSMLDADTSGGPCCATGPLVNGVQAALSLGLERVVLLGGCEWLPWFCLRAQLYNRTARTGSTDEWPDDCPGKPAWIRQNQSFN